MKVKIERWIRMSIFFPASFYDFKLISCFKFTDFYCENWVSCEGTGISNMKRQTSCGYEHEHVRCVHNFFQVLRHCIGHLIYSFILRHFLHLNIYFVAVHCHRTKCVYFFSLSKWTTIITSNRNNKSCLFHLQFWVQFFSLMWAIFQRTCTHARFVYILKETKKCSWLAVKWETVSISQHADINWHFCNWNTANFWAWNIQTNKSNGCK